MSDCFDHETLAYESADWSVFEDGAPGNFYARDVRCRRCYQAGLTWALNVNGKWQLHHGGVPHTCSRATIDDFDTLE